ncbi:MAG: hypothetical protein KAS15_00085 [Nanoarchaeota archaeon]|nr:hypothetical protein [Nanoarchaeota archaeon]MCK5630559.1 hypothetical protein [Nanoarchaeota archaeon]
MMEELSGILKIIVVLSWMSVLVTLFIKVIIKKKVNEAEKKAIDLEKIRTVKDFFLGVKRILVGSIIFLCAYVNLKFLLDISNVITLILVPGILIPALITFEIYISVMDILLKKGEEKLEVEE